MIKILFPKLKDIPAKELEKLCTVTGVFEGLKCKGKCQLCVQDSETKEMIKWVCLYLLKRCIEDMSDRVDKELLEKTYKKYKDKEVDIL